MKLNMKSWQSWRKEELPAVQKYLRSIRKSLRGKSEQTIRKHIRDGYLLRDLCVACLSHNSGAYTDEDVARVASGLKAITSQRLDFTRMVASAFKVWAYAECYEQVEAYLTPKSLLYTVRGDYETVKKKSYVITLEIDSESVFKKHETALLQSDNALSYLGTFDHSKDIEITKFTVRVKK